MVALYKKLQFRDTLKLTICKYHMTKKINTEYCNNGNK